MSVLRSVVWLVAGVAAVSACGGRSDFDELYEDGFGAAGSGAGRGGSSGRGGTGSGNRAGTNGVAGSGVAGFGGFSQGGSSFGGVGNVSASGGVSGSAAASGFGGFAAFGGFGAVGGSTSNGCVECIGSTCPQLLECLTTPACAGGIDCVAQTCMRGSQDPDLRCMLRCFDGDLGSAVLAFSAVACIENNCSGVCN